MKRKHTYNTATVRGQLGQECADCGVFHAHGRWTIDGGNRWFDTSVPVCGGARDAAQRLLNEGHRGMAVPR